MSKFRTPTRLLIDYANSENANQAQPENNYMKKEPMVHKVRLIMWGAIAIGAIAALIVHWLH